MREVARGLLHSSVERALMLLGRGKGERGCYSLDHSSVERALILLGRGRGVRGC